MKKRLRNELKNCKKNIFFCFQNKFFYIFDLLRIKYEHIFLFIPSDLQLNKLFNKISNIFRITDDSGNKNLGKNNQNCTQKYLQNNFDKREYLSNETIDFKQK